MFECGVRSIWFVAGIAVAAFSASAAADETARLTYNRDIRPILSDKCFQCHGPDSGTRKGKLRLDLRDDAMHSKAFIPGDSRQSELVARIHSTDPEEVMPPVKSPRKLNESEKEILIRWIQQGAEYEPLWSFVPIPSSVPVPASTGWGTGEVDRFIASRLHHEKLDPTQPASRERWLRRVTFDLTGLPPSAAELGGFLADQSDTARERVVTHLLESPRYGEHLAVDWLDVARYADSFGYQSDLDTQAWPYRDWVIRALNENLPWDQFITWQIAGDLIPNASRDQIIATAFNRIHRKTQEGGSVEAEYRQEGISDRVHTFGSAFLALTFECARCHDHKYDPISQKDYYSLGGFFNSIDEWGLLHGTGSIQPNPCLLLTTPAQDETIARQTRAIEEASKSSAEKRAARELDFQRWLANPASVWADLAGSYDLDEAENQPIRNSANPSMPATSNGKNRLITGHRGQAMQFTGDDPLSLGNLGVVNAEDPVSAAFWLKPGDPTPRAVVFHNSSGYDPGYNGFELLLEDGKLRWMVSREWPGNCIAVRTTQPIQANEWVHVAVTYDGSSNASGLKIYLNGSQAPMEMVRDHLTRNSGSASAFTFGERVRDSGLRGGAVDDIRLFIRAVTSLEIDAIFHEKSLDETVSSTPRDDAGMSMLRDYYFSAVDPETRAATATLHQLRQALRGAVDGVRELPVMREMQEPRVAKVLARGSYEHPEGSPLPRSIPDFLPPFPADLPRNRLGLAKWLTAPDHPLTARVQVNRVWQHFFGRGLVATSENFGSQGEAPSHPELLDWLARDFIDHGWDMKRLCRQIVLSSSYGQDSKTTPELRARDPNNVLLARGPLKRLSGEELRDQALALSGLLQGQIGGPPAKPYLPDAASWRVLNSFVPDYKQDHGSGLYRRSLYTFWRRTAPPPDMLAFDVPGRDVCTIHRQQTSTPLQPLVMLNSPQFVEAARGLAIRMLREGGEKRIDWLFREALGRSPSNAERQLLEELHAGEMERYRADHTQAVALLKVGELKNPPDLDPAALAAAAIVASAVINLDESITLR